MKDSLGTRMKESYENRFKTFLMRRTYTIIRIDGKAFHTFTKGLDRPFDIGLQEDMDAAAMHLCKHISGVRLAYVQSDEISLVITDFDEFGTQAWFDNNVQKITSVSASLATRGFNEARLKRLDNKMKWAEFDARVFQLPYYEEVVNYLLWRQRDATKNAISMAAQSVYSHYELHKKNGIDKQELLFQKGINFNDYDPKFKRGRAIIRKNEPYKDTFRSKWVSVEVPIFSQDRSFLDNLIPKNHEV